jgi:hypothetical protein
MEIIGDDKKIRALYSEARVTDGAATPSFTSAWHRAQARSLKPRRAFNLSLALVTALLVLTLGSLAVWSMYSPRSNQPHEAVTPGNVAPAVVNSPEKPKIEEDVKIAEKAPQAPIEAPVHRSLKSRVRRPTAQPNSQLIAQSSVKETTIDSWESPTAALLSSPTDGLFKSVPQLNENANEMKSFLPGRSNDKEK